MRCDMCGGHGVEVMVELHYCWSRDNPEVVRFLCSKCWHEGKDDPFRFGSRRDRETRVYFLGSEQGYSRHDAVNTGYGL